MNSKRDADFSSLNKKRAKNSQFKSFPPTIKLALPPSPNFGNNAQGEKRNTGSFLMRRKKEATPSIQIIPQEVLFDGFYEQPPKNSAASTGTCLSRSTFFKLKLTLDKCYENTPMPFEFYNHASQVKKF